MNNHLSKLKHPNTTKTLIFVALLGIAIYCINKHFEKPIIGHSYTFDELQEMYFESVIDDRKYWIEPCTLHFSYDDPPFGYKMSLGAFITPRDTISVIEFNRVDDNHIRNVAWAIPESDGKLKVIDKLKWDENEIQF